MVRPDAAWCSLCHADLRTQEERAAARPPEPWVADVVEEVPAWASGSAAAAGAAPADLAADLALAERRGRHARQAPAASAVTDPAAGRTADPQPAAVQATAELATVGSPVLGLPDPDAVLAHAGVDVEAMMSLLAAAQTKPLAPISGRLASKGSRAIAAVVAVVALTALGILVMSVLGLFVH